MATSLALFVVLATVLVLTVWKLWFKRDSALDPRVYTLGVRWMGLGTWAFLVVAFYFKLRPGLMPVIYLLPLFLWAGYWWGRVMTVLFPLSSNLPRPSNNHSRGP